jgi:hypothetical protein
MAEGTPDVTLGTLHGDLVDLKGEMGGLKAEMGGLRADVRDLKATVIAGFARMPTREQNEEMLAFLREANRRQEAGFARFGGDLRVLHLETRQFLRDQHDQNQQLLRAVLDSQRGLVDENRGLSANITGLSGDIKALIARIDAIIRGRNNGTPGG